MTVDAGARRRRRPSTERDDEEGRLHQVSRFRAARPPAAFSRAAQLWRPSSIPRAGWPPSSSAAETEATDGDPSRRSCWRASLLTPVGRAAVHLDDRAAGADALFLDAALQPARSRHRTASSGFENYRYFLTDPAFLASLRNTLVLVGSVLVDHRRAAASSLALLLDQPVFGQQHRAAHGDRAVLRHADGQRAGLEEPADASGLRAVRLDRHARSGCTPIDWFTDCAAARRSSSIVAWQWLPFATPHPAHRAAVARRGAEGGGRDGRRRRVLDSSSTSRCRISRAPITVVILIETIFLLTVFAEIFVTTGGGPGFADHQHRLPRLFAGAAPLRRRQRLGGRHRRGRPRQHRRLLPRPHRRQESGGLSHGARSHDGSASVVSTIVAWVVGFLIFFPILWTVLTSFKTELEAFAMPPKFLFFHWTTGKLRRGAGAQRLSPPRASTRSSSPAARPCSRC